MEFGEEPFEMNAPLEVGTGTLIRGGEQASSPSVPVNASQLWERLPSAPQYPPQIEPSLPDKYARMFPLAEGRVPYFKGAFMKVPQNQCSFGEYALYEHADKFVGAVAGRAMTKVGLLKPKGKDAKVEKKVTYQSGTLTWTAPLVEVAANGGKALRCGWVTNMHVSHPTPDPGETYAEEPEMQVTVARDVKGFGAPPLLPFVPTPGILEGFKMSPYPLQDNSPPQNKAGASAALQDLLEAKPRNLMDELKEVLGPDAFPPAAQPQTVDALSSLSMPSSVASVAHPPHFQEARRQSLRLKGKEPLQEGFEGRGKVGKTSRKRQLQTSIGSKGAEEVGGGDFKPGGPRMRGETGALAGLGRQASGDCEKPAEEGLGNLEQSAMGTGSGEEAKGPKGKKKVVDPSFLTAEPDLQFGTVDYPTDCISVGNFKDKLPPVPYSGPIQPGLPVTAVGYPGTITAEQVKTHYNTTATPEEAKEFAEKMNREVIQPEVLSVSGGQIVKVDHNGRIGVHNVATVPGVSGSALVLTSDPSKLVGIHRGFSRQANNHAVLVSHVFFLLGWVRSSLPLWQEFDWSRASLEVITSHLLEIYKYLLINEPHWDHLQIRAEVEQFLKVTRDDLKRLLPAAKASTSASNLE